MAMDPTHGSNRRREVRVYCALCISAYTCLRGGAGVLVKEVTQNFSEAVDRFKSGLERLVWSRAIDQCAKCVVVVGKYFLFFLLCSLSF